MEQTFTAQYKEQNYINMLTNKSSKTFNFIVSTSVHLGFRFWRWGYIRQPPRLWVSPWNDRRPSFVVWPHTHTYIYIIHIILCKNLCFLNFNCDGGSPARQPPRLFCGGAPATICSLLPSTWSTGTVAAKSQSADRLFPPTSVSSVFPPFSSILTNRWCRQTDVILNCLEFCRQVFEKY